MMTREELKKVAIPFLSGRPETNRQRCARLGIDPEDIIEQLSFDGELCDYCVWMREVGSPVQPGPNGPIMCEGRFCEEAAERWLDDEAEEEDD